MIATKSSDNFYRDENLGNDENLRMIFQDLTKSLGNQFSNEIGGVFSGQQNLSKEYLRSRVDELMKPLEVSDDHRAQIVQELLELGPLTSLISDASVSEIIVAGPDRILCEVDGTLKLSGKQFLSEQSYQNIVNKICSESGVFYTLNEPACQARFRQFRMQLVAPPLTQTVELSLRRHRTDFLSLEKLESLGFFSPQQKELIQDIIHKRESFLLLGNTGSGKTTLMNACLKELSGTERYIIIEDTDELSLPNPYSSKLLVRSDPSGQLRSIDTTELLKQTLRLRPDRIIVGEIRGAEASDFLLALSTGHAGGFSSMHASDPKQGLWRLEMLIQMGKPQWNLQTVRRLIFSSLKWIVVAERTAEGKRRISGIHKIVGLEDFGFLVEKQDSLTPLYSDFDLERSLDRNVEATPLRKLF